ncbi:unnamed protein product, partial [Oikopleura dioica]
MESAAFYPPAPNAFYSVSSESEYTTATDSSDEEDERPSGPIFIQPRVYETAGAGWQPVKVDGDEKDLDFALRKWKGQESSFGKTETLQLKQTNASELGSAAPGAPGPGMRLDDTIMKKLMKGRSLKNTVGQTVDPEENVMSDEEDDDFKRKAGDIYIPGEYLEKNHESWRTPEQIERYRANMAFLNRLKPNDLKPKSKIDRHQLYEGLPAHARGRTDAQLVLYLANKARLEELKKKYSDYEPVYPSEPKILKESDTNSTPKEANSKKTTFEGTKNGSKSEKSVFNHSLSRKSNLRKSRKARKISVDRSKLGRTMNSTLNSTMNESTISRFDDPAEEEDVEFSGLFISFIHKSVRTMQLTTVTTNADDIIANSSFHFL